MDYVPNRKQEQEELLKAIGAERIEQLFENVKPQLNRPLQLPKPLSEWEIKQTLEQLSLKNTSFRAIFRGAGAYHHYIPSAINQILLRSEFYTAYTPYQAEVSQGTLTAIYEFQTYICMLTGMDAANASMYDAASALAETALMAYAQNERREVVCSNTVHPHYVAAVRTYCQAHDMTIKTNESDISDQTACVMIQYPNFFGEVEDVKALAEKAHANGALFVVCIGDASSMALLEPPASLGADIVVGDAQAFGIPIGGGGPYAGFLAVRKEYIRRMPGRLSGMTKDDRGQTGFILTLQAREQHIRREKATSNLCTNQALMALGATIYLSLLGKNGLQNVAKHSYTNAHRFLEQLQREGFHRIGSAAFYNEFRVKSPVDVNELNARLARIGILGGLALPNNEMLVCCTECITETHMREFVEQVRELKTLPANATASPHPIP
ncbi:aminomethyl-transferring glycine dehydrogenase subunit GcvPA [Candidatus Micrarchaeota archaeon]|nr:aminomethyl-transferring glycine dehydrogenase subunit GcvPA [Candidatus Micrarchaeota archaeon]